ncbi:hypothetical protein BraRD5C2_43870 [Bradyrhizobium sp. RD5-C2]|nr:hypothetical protein BraRD5C2_43870 [Bradyrhizobium sp. RD5-C2]
MPKVSTTLPDGMKALLDQCVARKLYGDEAATIRQFINDGLERLIGQRRIIDAPTVASSLSIGETRDG